jgi:hypothetical protein
MENMNTSKIKSALHESIENINDLEVLKTMNEISLHHYNILKEPELNDYELNRIIESEKQISDGNYFTNEQANELFEKWLKK